MMNKKIPLAIVALVIVVAALYVLTSMQTQTTSPECGDNFCASGETLENCPDDCAEDDEDTLCRDNADCKSGVCNFIKQDFGECGAVDCEDGDEALGIDGQVKFECQERIWVEVEGDQTCKDNPMCGLQLLCDDPNQIRVLRKDQYSGKDCIESWAQMILPTVCIECGDGVCSEEESECNCPVDCKGRIEPVNYSCESDSDCVSTCGAGCVNTDWANTYDDPCINKRAWDCTCIDSECYTDGQPPEEDKTLEERYNEMTDDCLDQNDDWLFAVEECIEKSPIYDEYKAECEAENGYFGQQGLYPVPYCNPKTSDAGEECTDSSQCEGECLSEDETIRDNAVGECSGVVYVFGCIAPVNEGKVEYVICID